MLFFFMDRKKANHKTRKELQSKGDAKQGGRSD